MVPKLPLPLLKICDFGYSKADFKSAAKSKVGTLTYMAPEVLVSPSRDGKYDGKVSWVMGFSVCIVTVHGGVVWHMARFIWYPDMLVTCVVAVHYNALNWAQHNSFACH